MVKFKRGDIVQVDWGDAWTASGWQPKPKDETCTSMPCTSVGAFLMENKHGILLTMGFDPNGKSNNEHFIPKGMIMKRKLLVKNKKVKTSY